MHHHHGLQSMLYVICLYRCVKNAYIQNIYIKERYSINATNVSLLFSKFYCWLPWVWQSCASLFSLGCFCYSLLKKFQIFPPALPFHLCYKVFSEVSIKLLTVVVIAPENKGTTVLLQLNALFSLRSLCFTQWCSSWTTLNLSALWAALTVFFRKYPTHLRPPTRHCLMTARGKQ